MPLSRLSVTLALATALVAGAAPAAAQQTIGQNAANSGTSPSDPAAPYYTANEPNVPEKAGKVLHAFRLDGAAPTIDGSLDDAAWSQAEAATDMVQWDPEAMVPMTEGTAVRVLYDDRYVYVGVELTERDPSQIVRGIGRRDRPPQSDKFEVMFDTQHDHLTGYVFGANASGVQEDYYFYDDTSRDNEYNVVWEVETRATERGWIAEYRIPFSQMRFSTPPTRQVVWGLDFRRTIQRRNETGQWIGKPRSAPGQVSRWGHLVFDEGLVSPRRIEALPYVMGRADNPATTEIEEGWDAGLDVRTGLGRSATLAATFNPDFGQVEADPAVLNLSVFETFFPEKRPFFLEDGTIFVPQYFLFQLFNSRRIGKRPNYLSIPSGETVLDRPDQTTILGAGKVTGKNAGYTYGLVSAVTSAEHAQVRTAAGTTTERLIEPTTSYSAARVQRDFGSGSNAGLLATTVLREGNPDAFSAGVDWRLRWAANRWQWNGHLAGTHAPLSGEMVEGVGGVTNLVFGGKRWNFNAHGDYFTKRFRPTDMGFLRTRVDRIAGNVGGGYSNPDRWNVGGGGGEAYTHSGLRIERWANVFGGVQLLNFWNLNANLNYGFPFYDDVESRGGLTIRNPSNWGYWFGINSDPRKRWTMFLFNYAGRDAEGGWWMGAGPNLNLRVSPAVQLSASGSLDITEDVAQWVSNQDVTGDGVNDAIYAPLRSNVVNVTLRGSVAVNRDLTFEGFLQPFVAVGDYDAPMRLARDKSFDFEPVAAGTISDPDFSTHSLRGTFVLRWEYLRGSALFFAWNVQGSDASRPGVFSPMRDFGDTFGAPLDHRFMVKANYWLSL
jgi:hypothetical protein